MAKKKSKLQIAQEKTQESVNLVNNKIEILGIHTNKLYIETKIIQEMFDNIRNKPTKYFVELEKTKEICLEWKNQAEKIEKDYQKAYTKEVGAGAVGAGLGVAVAAMGPTVAMGVATTFGVASTGTAIAALHGIAATNAALAWLGGGALAVGGGGVAAGNAFLAMAGPVGWSIAGLSLLMSGVALVVNHSNQKSLENIFTLISERDVSSYKLSIVELNERITRIEEESEHIHNAIKRIQSFGIDYKKMTEAQQYELGSYVNLLSSCTQLLTNPILGLQPKYTESDFNVFYSLIKERTSRKDVKIYFDNKNAIISLCNLLYKIDLDDKEKKLLWEALRKNKQFLESLEKKKKDFPYVIFAIVQDALNYKYKTKASNN